MRTRRVQDKAWAIDLHLVKHSGMGKAAAVLGGEKVDWWAAILMFLFLSFLQNTFSNKFGEGWLHFGMRMIASFWGIGYASIADSEVLGGG